MTQDIEQNNSSDAFENAEYEAAHWIIRLSEEPDNKELRAEFDAWKDASELNAELYDDIRAASDLIEDVPPVTREMWEPSVTGSPVPETEIQTVATSTPPSLCPNQKHSFLDRLLTPLLTHWKLSACAGICLFGILYLFIPAIYMSVEADYYTGTAEQQTLRLSDGSLIDLAPQSAIQVNYSDAKRQIILIKGEAFFSVNSNPQRPFIVQADTTLTRVLGTEFMVKRSDTGAQVSVAEGRVMVEDSSLTSTLSKELLAGDKIQLTRGKDYYQSRVSTTNIAAWRNGELVVKNQTVEELIDVIRMYYKGVIILQSERLKNLRVSGLYQLDSPQKTLRNLAESHGARIQQISPWIILIKDQ